MVHTKEHILTKSGLDTKSNAIQCNVWHENKAVALLGTRRSIGNGRQINGPHQGAHIDKERNPLLRNERVAHQIDNGPKAGTRQPRARQVATNLAPPIAWRKLSRLEQARGKENARKGWTEKGLSQGSLLQRGHEARAGQELENRTIPVVRRRSKVQQANGRGRGNARNVQALLGGRCCLGALLVATTTGTGFEPLRQVVAHGKDASGRDTLGDNGTVLKTRSVKGSNGLKGSRHSGKCECALGRCCRR